jgi:hypothetical protein
MRPYLEKTHLKKGLVGWLKVSSNPNITKKKERKKKNCMSSGQ